MRAELTKLVQRALEEDVGAGDITTEAVVDPELEGHALLVARTDLVLCGLPVAAEVFRQVDSRIDFSPLQSEGCRVGAGQSVAKLCGPLAGILTGERVALNFVQRLSGIATLVSRYVEALHGHSVRLVDTRKTTPGLRALEKYAVRVGGAANHRFRLDDGVMIKDNHILAAGGITEAVRRALKRAHHLLQVQVEVDNLEQAHEAVGAGARVLLLDNFEPELLREAVTDLRSLRPDLVLEASGGIALETVASVAATGVDVISCGSLIHQAQWLDLALDVVPR